MKFHPACDWPYSPERVSQYVLRLQAGDVPPPVTFVGELILDGRHRAEAWRQVYGNLKGMPSQQLPTGEDPIAYIFRQHMGMETRLSFSEMHAQICRYAERTGSTFEKCLSIASPRYAKKLLNFHALKEGKKTRAPRTASVSDPLDEHRATRLATELRAENKKLLERLDRATKRSEVAQDAAKAPIVAFKPSPTPTGKRRLTAVVLASDWHVEEPVNPSSVGGANEYNLTIAEARINRFFNAIIWNLKHQRSSGHLSIDDMIIWLGGDFISGYIHKDLERSNFLSPTQAIRWLKPRIAAGLREVRKHVSSLRVPVSYGNHGRLNEKALVQCGAEDSIEQLMYYMLADELVGVGEFTIPETNHVRLDVYDYRIHFHHGDDVRGGGGIGGLAPPLLRRQARWNDQSGNDADFHCIGHFHQLVDFGNVVINGSLIGFGPYSQKIGAPDEPAQQAMFYIDEKRGKTMLTSLWVAK